MSSFQKLRVVVMALPTDDCCDMLKFLPSEATVIAKGKNLEEMNTDAALNNEQLANAECLLVVTGGGSSLGSVINAMKALKWIHGIFAGLDHLSCPEFDNCSRDRNIVVTNAKGVFSSSLAEWVMGSIWYFNKDIPRLNRNKDNKSYERYTVGEIRGKTMGIIGYGDIGRACAKLANAYGMRVIAHRRRPELSVDDPLVEKVYGNKDINMVVSNADYLVVAAALTPETKGMIGEEQFAVAKKGQVILNVGRGALLDEDALIRSLESGVIIKAAALDVFCTEPLPLNNKLWELKNVLMSPHNADMTNGFRHDSVKFFTENCNRFIAGEGDTNSLMNKVEASAGY